jgi:hypothetical protein
MSDGCIEEMGGERNMGRRVQARVFRSMYWVMRKRARKGDSMNFVEWSSLHTLFVQVNDVDGLFSDGILSSDCF